MTGLERIQSVFAQAKAQGRAVFMPYHAMGYPSRVATLEIVEALRDNRLAGIQAGKIIYGDAVGQDKYELSGDFRGATLHIATQYMNAPGAPLWSAEDFRAALRRYLDWAAKRYGRPQLRGIEKRERELPDITLERVYVSLAAMPDPQTYEGQRPDRGRRMEPEEMMSGEAHRLEPVNMAGLLKDNARLVITGAPGSGKTTYLYVIASTLARAMLTGRAEDARVALGLTGPLPLPIYISLGDYNRYRLGRREPGDPEHGTLLAYARYALIRQLGGLNLPNLLKEVAQSYLRRAMDEAHGNKTNAAKLVDANGLLADDSADVVDRRETFAAGLREVVECIGVVRRAALQEMAGDRSALTRGVTPT